MKYLGATDFGIEKTLIDFNKTIQAVTVTRKCRMPDQKCKFNQ